MIAQQKPEHSGKKGVNVYENTHKLLLELCYFSKEDFGARLPMRHIVHEAVEQYSLKYRGTGLGIKEKIAREKLEKK